MPRRNHVPYHLDARGIRRLSEADLRAILRGADSMIASGGRTLLSKLLKGSREKKVLELGLDRNPSWGFYRDVPIEDVLARIDWAIQHEYLRIIYEGRLPVLVFTEQGWAIEIETMAEELLRGFDARLAGGSPYDMTDLRDRNRGLVFRLLWKVEHSGRRELVPLLEAWESIAYRKTRERIRWVIAVLRGERAPLQVPTGCFPEDYEREGGWNDEYAFIARFEKGIPVGIRWEHAAEFNLKRRRQE